MLVPRVLELSYVASRCAAGTIYTRSPRGKTPTVHLAAPGPMNLDLVGLPNLSPSTPASLPSVFSASRPNLQPVRAHQQPPPKHPKRSQESLCLLLHSAGSRRERQPEETLLLSSGWRPCALMIHVLRAPSLPRETSGTFYSSPSSP